MSQTLDQIFISNPITTNAATDLMYFAQSPYSAGHDAAMTYANFKAQIIALFNTKAIVIPVNMGTVNLLATHLYTILNPAGTLATLTVNMPGSPADGQIQTVSTTQIISALTVGGGGNTIIGQPTALIVGQSFSMIYNIGDTTWYPA